MRAAVRRLARSAAALMPRGAAQEIKTGLGVPSMEASLRLLKGRGFEPAVAVDVGAYAGEWTKLCKSIFPKARVLMVEPQRKMAGHLRRVCAELGGVEVAPVLLGAAPCDGATFHEQDSASSVLEETEKPGQSAVTVPMTTLEGITRNTVFARPELIKLDVQGYEIEVLRGGEETLALTEVVIMEVNLLEVYRGAALFEEAVAFMAARGFRVADVCSLIRRPYDGALWQMDVAFVRGNSPLMASKRWA